MAETLEGTVWDFLPELARSCIHRRIVNVHMGVVFRASCIARYGVAPSIFHSCSYLAQVVFRYSEALALDLRVFAKHGKRAVVGVDDIKCVARKDPKLASMTLALQRATARTTITQLSVLTEHPQRKRLAADRLSFCRSSFPGGKQHLLLLLNQAYGGAVLMLD